ncbi:MAG: hypothetical protein IE922_15405 [Sphingomonadales bacterium]|nr:hypothetical protein [Sphingomonadales bacterium]
MTQHRLVTLRLSADLIAALETEAHRREISPAQMIRVAIVETVRRKAGDGGAATPGGNYMPRPSLIAATFDAAESWLDLQSRLRAEGLVLRLHEESWGSEARIALHDWPADRFVAWLDETGQSLAELTMRFRAPFPGQMRRAPITLPPGAFRALRKRSALRLGETGTGQDDERAA